MVLEKENGSGSELERERFNIRQDGEEAEAVYEDGDAHEEVAGFVDLGGTVSTLFSENLGIFSMQNSQVI